MSRIYFDKWVHLFMYAIMFIAYAWGLQERIKNQQIRYLLILILVTGIGFVTELLQNVMNQGRNFELFDIIANITGASLGLAIWKLKLK